MSAFPTGAIVTTNVDAGSDSPNLARADIKSCFDKVNDIIASKNLANGTLVADAAGKAPHANIPITPIATSRKVVTSTGSNTWTVPAGCIAILLKLVGAGASGAFGNPTHGGGGGGGGSAEVLVSVLAGDIVNYTIGSGGAGIVGPGDANGNNGVTSTITVTRGGTTIASFEAQGGIGGRDVANGSTGGEGGIAQLTGSGGDNANVVGDPLFLAGGVGGTGTAAMGGMGGQSFGGSAPSNSSFLWGGGGGYGSGTGGPSSTAGNAGMLIITY